MATERGAVETLYDRVRALTDVLKSDFVATLDLQPPNGMDGDND